MHIRPKSAEYLLEKDGSPSKWFSARIERKQAVQQLFQPRNSNQLVWLPKINIYLAQHKKPLLRPLPGYCHGITLLWLYLMSKGKASWFYDVIDKLLSSTSSSLQKVDPDIEKFIAYIDWGQNSEKYTHGDSCVHWWEVDKILKIPQVDAQYQWVSDSKLYTFFQQHFHQNNMIVLSRLESKIMHTIGVFVSDSLYYLFDPNSSSGRPKTFDSTGSLIDEIKLCMYAEPHQPMLLDAHVLKNPEPVCLPPSF